MSIISTPLKIQIKDFKPWLEKETVSILQPLNEQGRKLVDKVKERLDDARETCEKLAEEGNKELERGKAVRKAKVTEKLSRYFLKQINKITVPNNMSFTGLEQFHRDLSKVFSYIARERNVWFPRISPLFIIARKRVDFAFSRLTGSISELGAFLAGDFSKARLVEELFSEANRIVRFLDELEDHESQRAAIEEKVRFFERKIEENERRIESTKTSAELDDLAEINQKIQSLKRQVKHDLRHLEKPFMKFVNVAGAAGYALNSEEVEKLSQYLEDPFVALATEDSGYPILKSIAKKVERAISEGKLKLKSSRLRKAQDDINSILAGSMLDGLQRDCAQVFLLSRQLASSEGMQLAKRRLEKSQRRLEELRKRREVVASRLEALERERGQLSGKVDEQKGLLEKSVYRLLGKHVSVEL